MLLSSRLLTGLLLLSVGLLAPGQSCGQLPGRGPMPDPLATTPCLAAAPDSARQLLLQGAAALRAAYRESEALGEYEQLLGRAPATYEALWQAAVLSVRIGNRYTDETRRLTYYAAARLYANRALVVCPEAAEGHYAAALVLAAEAPLQPLRSRLLAYREMRPHVYRATEQLPNWADAWQLLGRWQYRIDHYSLPERLYSRFLLGGVPEGGSTLQAIESLRRAYELEPGRIEFGYDLARVYLNRSQYARARTVLTAALRLAPVTAEEFVLNRRCELLLAQLNRRQQRQYGRRLPLRLPF